MSPALISTLFVLLMAFAVVALFAVALSGALAKKAPTTNARLKTAMRHLNGEAEAPEPFARYFG